MVHVFGASVVGGRVVPGTVVVVVVVAAGVVVLLIPSAKNIRYMSKTRTQQECDNKSGQPSS